MSGKTDIKPKKVAVGLSGGVDSAVSAYLLKEQGYDVVGIFMKCWERENQGCGPDPDKASAVMVAAHLDIRFKQLDFSDQYNNKVIQYFYNEYKAGRTPNPDVMCNKEIKFGLFFDWAMKEGYDFVATGHYAIVRSEFKQELRTPPDLGYGIKSKLCLLKGVDEGKDQSYFLYLMKQKHLSKTLFPLGEMTKKEVRSLAKEIKLPNADRPDSTGICFIGEVDIKEFLEKEIEHKEGNILNIKGELIGKHTGISFYTIGQRKGFDIKSYSGKPLYVISKNVENNELVVGEKKDAYGNEFRVSNLHWINSKPSFPLKCGVRIRHLGEIHKCTIMGSKGALNVVLDKPIFAVAPGQSAVFYDESVVLGGGIIE